MKQKNIFLLNFYQFIKLLDEKSEFIKEKYGQEEFGKFMNGDYDYYLLTKKNLYIFEMPSINQSKPN